MYGLKGTRREHAEQLIDPPPADESVEQLSETLRIMDIVDGTPCYTHLIELYANY
ncbi:MAG: hypothetical protein JSV76_04985 [Candidatus Bathyarchaeota archaeon]|nr:MAG: hypothetical protein JSV76_04985 [Candidatus Bathyarchaeota archaeon]